MKTLKIVILIMLFPMFSSVLQAGLPIRPPASPRPAWAPVGHAEARYYYLQDIEVYYDIPSSMYIHLSGGKWIRSRHLPSRCADYDFHRGHTIVITDYHGSSPYIHFKHHKTKYPRFNNPPRHEVNRRIEMREKHDNGWHKGQYKNDDKGRGRGNDKDFKQNGKGNDKGNKREFRENRQPNRSPIRHEGKNQGNGNRNNGNGNGHRK